MRSLFIFFLSLLLMAGCRSLDKALEEGEYEYVIDRSVQKLADKRKKEKYVIALESAFNKSQEKDLSQIEVLKETGAPESWEGVIRRAENIESKQQKIRPFLPLVSRDGYVASFHIVNTAAIIREARQKTIETWYREGERLLELAREGDRHSARHAYEIFQNVIQRDPAFRNVKALAAESKSTGMVTASFSVINNTNEDLPSDLIQKLTPAEFYPSNWLIWKAPEDNPEVTVDFVLDDVIVSPDIIREEVEKIEREIEDGWRYALDKEGYRIKDSLGNDIRVPVNKVVNAISYRTIQEKNLEVRATLIALDSKSGNIYLNDPLSAHAEFRHSSLRVEGDPRALPSAISQTERRMRSFPTTEEMLMGTAEELRKEMRYWLSTTPVFAD